MLQPLRFLVLKRCTIIHVDTQAQQIIMQNTTQREQLKYEHPTNLCKFKIMSSEWEYSLLEAARLIAWLRIECQMTQVAQVKVET